MIRVGLGQDSHPLIKKGSVNKHKALVLGGVEIECDYYLKADSDGDVIIHAICNSLSTAIGGGSLDTWTGKMFRQGITDSRKFLGPITKKLIKQNYQIINLSIMVEASQPRLEKHRTTITDSLAKLLNINPDQIGIAFTSGEGLTSFGKGKAIQVFCNSLIAQKNFLPPIK